MTSDTLLTDTSREKNLVIPQEKVLDNLFLYNNNVIVSAGAGTGKTTTMVEAVAEAVLRKNKKHKNPFEKILVVTFTVEAARQLKEETLNRLVQHYEMKEEKSKKINKLKRQVENESWILTLDKFTRRVLNEEMIEAGIGSLDEVTDDFELHNIREKVIREIKEEYEELTDILQDWAPKHRYNRTENNHWEAAIWNVLRDGRQLAMSAKEVMEEAWRTFEEDLFLNKNPKEGLTEEDRKKISDNLTGPDDSLSEDKLENIYKKYEELLEAFKKVLLEAEKRYDDKTKSEGKLTYDDVRYHIIQHINEDDKGEEFRKNRFDYVFVDEFQDTSHAQCDLLKAFISDETSVALIGDPRQSIYQWREADPNIFSQMVDKLDDGNCLDVKIEKLGVEGFKKIDLDVNFRSNKNIVQLTNNLFGNENNKSLFKRKKFTPDIALPHNNLQACENRKKADEKFDRKSIHLYRSSETSTKGLAKDWAKEISNILSQIDDNKNGYEILEEKDNGDIGTREAELGDCWILMRSRSKWQHLKRELNSKNIDYIFVNQKGLFKKSPSIQIIIDILNWIENPHDFESLARIVRSPLLGLEDKTLRYIASEEFKLDWVENKNPDFIEKRDIEELKELINLREDLRWKREDRKSKLVESILQFSAFDVVSLTATEGIQELGNIMQFQQVIDEWEDEQLMSFQEFIERINFYRDFGTDEAEFNFAPLAEQEEKESVKITTVHSAKGLGYPIVFHYNPDSSISYNLLSLADNDLDIIIKRKREKKDETFVSIGLNYLGNFDEGIYFNEDNERNPFQKFKDANKKINSIDNKSKKEMTNIFDRYRIFNQWSEEWRVFYVALTRAEDHIFLPFRDYPGKRYSWEKIYHKMDDNDLLFQGCKYEDDIEPSERSIDVDELDLPDLEKKTLENYVPTSLSISHLYDLIACPRRYQYIALQKVSGPSDCEGVGRPKGVVFGSELHKAMESSDFKDYEINDNFLKNDLKDEVKKAMEAFYNSYVYQRYKFGSRDTLKEEEFYYPLHINGHKVTLEGKVDCLMKSDDGLVVLDYKTVNPDNKFEKRHQKYQLLGYSYLLENLYPEIGVSKAVLLYYDRKTGNWNDEEVSLELERFEEELRNSLPVELDDEGLRTGNEPPCEEEPGKEYCSEVIRLCK